MMGASTANVCARPALWLLCICHAMALLIGVSVYAPSLAQADEGLGLEDTYEPGYDESNYYGAPWYSKGQEELNRLYGRHDGGSDSDSGLSSAERRKANERREAEQQEANMRLYRERVAAHEAMCQHQLPALTDAVRVHRERFELLQSQVRYNADVASVAYTADTFAETYGVVGEVAQQVQAAEAAFEAQLDASEMLTPPLGPEHVDALGMAIQGAPFQTQASMDGYDALVLTSVQHQEVSSQVMGRQAHAKERTALLDGAALFIAGADQSFADADAATGYSLLEVAQEGLDMVLMGVLWTVSPPAGAAWSITRALTEYTSGYDLITGAPVDFDMLETVGMAMTLFPGVGRPFAKLAKVFGKVARTDGPTGLKARQFWRRMTGLKRASDRPEVVRDLDRASGAADKRFEAVVKDPHSGDVRWGSWEQYAKTTIKGREYALIDGRLYTRHATDRMLPRTLGARAYTGAPDKNYGRGIPTLMVEEVIKYGDTLPPEFSALGNARVVKGLGRYQVVLEDDIVVTVRYVRGAK